MTYFQGKTTLNLNLRVCGSKQRHPGRRGAGGVHTVFSSLKNVIFFSREDRYLLYERYIIIVIIVYGRNSILKKGRPTAGKTRIGGIGGEGDGEWAGERGIAEDPFLATTTECVINLEADGPAIITARGRHCGRRTAEQQPQPTTVNNELPTVALSASIRKLVNLYYLPTADVSPTTEKGMGSRGDRAVKVDDDDTRNKLLYCTNVYLYAYISIIYWNIRVKIYILQCGQGKHFAYGFRRLPWISRAGWHRGSRPRPQKCGGGNFNPCRRFDSDASRFTWISRIVESTLNSFFSRFSI